MNRKRLWVCMCLAALLLAGGVFAQAKSLKIGTATGRNVTVPITMDSDENVQGFVLSVAFDDTKLQATDVRAAGATTAAGAELVVGEILAGDGFTLGVVLDFPREDQ